MAHVVFAVPFALDATLRFVRAAAELEAEGLRLAVVSQERAERFPEELRRRFAAYEQIRDALDPDQLTAGVRGVAKQLDGRVDRLIGILEPLQESLAQTRENLGIPGMRPDAARRFRDKAHMKDVLRTSGLPCARHELCESPDAALAGARKVGYPLVAKPPAGAGARNTMRVNDERELASLLRSAAPRRGAPILLEEFLAGEEFSFDTVTLQGKHVFHSINHYAPSPLEVMETPWIQWTVLCPREIKGPEFRAIHEAGPKALDALGMEHGITHMEWFRREDGSIAISEVAARPPGAQFTTLMSYAHDLDFYKAWVRIVGLDRFEVPERKYAAGAAYLRGQGQGRVSGIEGLEQAQKELGELVVEAKLPTRGQGKAAGYEGEGYVILRHEDTERVRRGLQRLVSLLRVQMA